MPNLDGGEDNESPEESIPDEPNVEAHKFYKLLKDAKNELYPGFTKFSKLSFLVRLFHLKCLNGWSNKSFDMSLELLKEAHLVGEMLSKNHYESKKILRDLGLHYIKIDDCPNDCMLYWKEYENTNECAVCGEFRWKSMTCHSTKQGVTSSTKDKKIAAKILRSFPLKPRLQRLFMSSKTAEYMRWHDHGRIKDEVLRHPTDSEAWSTLDNEFPKFSSEPRNVRLGLARYGFNPFNTMSIAHGTWSVILIPYNLPPWMCMKQSFFMLSLFIPGPESPGNDIDVYRQPLIEELKELWTDGVETYDASSKQNFQMHAAVLWTISDFPAYLTYQDGALKGKKLVSLATRTPVRSY